jgi:hypothetical protein
MEQPKRRSSRLLTASQRAAAIARESGGGGAAEEKKPEQKKRNPKKKTKQIPDTLKAGITAKVNEAVQELVALPATERLWNTMPGEMQLLVYQEVVCKKGTLRDALNLALTSKNMYALVGDLLKSRDEVTVVYPIYMTARHRDDPNFAYRLTELLGSNLKRLKFVAFQIGQCDHKIRDFHIMILFLTFRSLTHLTMPKARNLTVASLIEVSELTTLEQLTIYMNEKMDKQPSCLQKIVNSNSATLKRLKVVGRPNGTGEHMSLDVAKSLGQCPVLESLEIYSTNVTMADVREILKCKTLKKLTLDGNRWMARNVSEWPDSPQLVRLSVESCNFNAAMMTQITDNCPNLKVCESYFTKETWDEKLARKRKMEERGCEEFGY